MPGYPGGTRKPLSTVAKMLVDAPAEDLGWLLKQTRLAGININDWWLAGYRRFGHPPPPRSVCAQSLQDSLDADIAAWGGA